MSDSRPFALPPRPGGWPPFLPGWVWLAGAGPGDPGLLTLHGLSALAQADTVIHDALVAPELLDWARPGAEIVAMGKRGWTRSPGQAEITARLIELARAGKRVLRLKGGDPFVFGRGPEEARALAHARIPFRILPGISAGIGGLAHAGIPVTHGDGGTAVTFVTGHRPEAIDWAAIARASPTLVIYMGLRNFPAIRAALLKAGRDPQEPLAAVARAASPAQQVLETTLGQAPEAIAAAGIAAPAMLCLGPAVGWRKFLEWQPFPGNDG